MHVAANPTPCSLKFTDLYQRKISQTPIYIQLELIATHLNSHWVQILQDITEYFSTRHCGW